MDEKTYYPKDALVLDEHCSFGATPDARKIHKVVEKMPLYVSGDCRDVEDYAARKSCADRAMLNFIYKHIRYPEKAKNKNVQGMVVVSFVVEPNGTMTGIKVVRDPGAGLGEAAASVVRKMQEDKAAWEPGVYEGVPVRVQFNLPVKFKLE